MQSLVNYIQGYKVNESKVNIKLYPVEDTLNQVKVVQIGEPFEMGDKEYFNQVRTALLSLIGFIPKDYNDYESCINSLEEITMGDEVVWVYDASEEDYGAYVIQTKYIGGLNRK